MCFFREVDSKFECAHFFPPKILWPSHFTISPQCFKLRPLSFHLEIPKSSMGKPLKRARAGDHSATKNKENEDPTLAQQDKQSNLLSAIIAVFAVGSCSIEFIMLFLDAGYEINSSEAD